MTLPTLHFKLSHITLWFLTCVNIPTALSTNPLTDPTDFSWVKSFAGVGESYAAGLYVGELFQSSDAAKCSRYDGGYSNILYQSLANKETISFHYLACWGAKVEDIKSQVETLPQDSQDLMTVSAGGNDLGFGNVLLACVASDASTNSGCDAAIEQANLVINLQLSDLIDSLITTIDSRMRPESVVVFSLYAQFFNDTTDACSYEDWTLPLVGVGAGVSLTPTVRGQLNDLVKQANTVIRQAVISGSDSSRKRAARYVIANWDDFAGYVSGRFCEQGAPTDPDDPANADLMFQKTDTTRIPTPSSKRRRGVRSDLVSRDERESQQLAKRSTIIRDLIDKVGRIFHPTLLGQETIATFAKTAIIAARAGILKVPVPGCVVDKASCLPSGGNYTTIDSALSALEQWCSDTGSFNCWKFKNGNTYNWGSTNRITLSEERGSIQCPTQDQCLDAGQAIINQCTSDSGSQFDGGNILLPGNGTLFMVPQLKGTVTQLQCASDHDRPGGASHFYANGDDMASHIQDFCHSAADDNPGAGYHHSTVWDQGNLDQVQFMVIGPADLHGSPDYKITYEQCTDAMSSIMADCDHNPVNPLHWHSGGSYTVDNGLETYYSITPQFVGRPYPWPTEVTVECIFNWDDTIFMYLINGGGFLLHGGGQLHDALTAACPPEVQGMWAFNYGRGSLSGGIEWIASNEYDFGHPKKAPAANICLQTAIWNVGGGAVTCTYDSDLSLVPP